ncbi:hypothetical protein DYD21_09415 [Rhodohalobacter sp. SW132]|uniref:HNH endonuclease n=1 Tax=Rhodohalobacter sp. SW132 TaxID=2293433 RepID=UPI000E25DA73|nr:HNH endonuclease [Rhodohalobacter sp. SW132]REL33616.1 hypothetical protein DYD21_09415 [Rhodohalobacter sp. SW132]
MADRKEIYHTLRLKMEDAGFQFEKEQRPHRQNRKENELVFVHPLLIEKFDEDGYEVRAEKFYIKPLSDEPDCEIGLVTGTTSALFDDSFFVEPNAIDSHKKKPAWTNRENQSSLDRLLMSIVKYLGSIEKQSTNQTFIEGNARNILQTSYERSTEAREVCLKHHGFSCKVCDFNFEEKFGEVGKGFIHVHHRNQISETGGEYEVDPISDLIPVCPNCHAMIHSKRPAFTVEQIRNIRKVGS